MIRVLKVGILRDLTTDEMEGVLVLLLPSGEEIPCAVAVDDAQVLLALEGEALPQAGADAVCPEDYSEEDALGPLNPNDKRAHAVPTQDGYGDFPAGPKVKVP